MPFYLESLRKPPLLFSLCENAENDPFWTKNVHGCPAKTPVSHIAPISRMHAGWEASEAGGEGVGFLLLENTEGWGGSPRRRRWGVGASSGGGRVSERGEGFLLL